MKHRISVSLFFFINGFLYGNWVARLPELKSFFSVSNSVLGTLLLMTSVGALVSMPLTGGLVRRIGDRRLTLIAGLLFAAFIPLVVVSHQLWLARLAFFLVGFSSGALDVSMNGQGVRVERLWAKSIMSSFHALFSIGMALGAATGFLFSYARISIETQLLLLSAGSIIVLLFASQNLLPSAADTTTEGSDKSRGKVIFTAYLIAISIIAFCGMTGEGSMADWSAIYLHTVAGATESFSAIAFFSFSAAMTVGRLSGDLLINRFGRQRMLVADCLVAIAGLVLALLVVSPYAIISGFFLVGLGLATIVPLVYSAAGNLEGMEPSAGIAAASTIGYTGFFFGPPLIGYLSDAFGLRMALCYPLLLFAVMFFLVRKFIR